MVFGQLEGKHCNLMLYWPPPTSSHPPLIGSLSSSIRSPIKASSRSICALYLPKTGLPLNHYIPTSRWQWPNQLITYQFGVHQFWRNLFNVLGHFLIWGIDIIHSPFLVTALDYSLWIYCSRWYGSFDCFGSWEVVYFVKLSLILLVHDSHSTKHLKEYNRAVKYFNDIVCIILPWNI